MVDPPTATSDEVHEYRYDHISFLLTDKKTAFQVGTQFFVLVPLESYYYKRLQTIRLLIDMGQIQSLDTLAQHCNGKVAWQVSKRSRLCYNT